MKDEERKLPRAVEVKTYGLAACRALWKRRPDDILRVYTTAEVARIVGPLLAHCAERRRPYRVVPASELETITESRHHEGLCIVASPRPNVALPEVLTITGPACILALAGIENPHNLGAIVRSAAHFGAHALLLGEDEPRLAGAAARTAQGGAEWVDVVRVPALVPALLTCRRAGFTIVATSNQEGRALFDEPLPPRVVVLLGSERAGLSPDLLRSSDLIVRIPGTDHVDSLNVAAAAAVLLAESWRRRARPAP